MQGRAGAGPSGQRSNPRAQPPPVLPPPPQFATDEDEMPPNQIAQVIALICGLLVVILMVLGLASADWLMAAGWRQGLFMHCIDPDAPTPLPFDIVAQPGCYAARPTTYIKAAAGLCVATLAADVCGALLTGLGLRAADHRTKFRYYRFAVLAMALALMCILIALVIYPVCFAAELNLDMSKSGNRSVWEFGWAYGVGWGAAIFLFGAVVLLLCDKESEELYYKERKVVTAESSGRP
ncbi:transmembrane protein 47 isoform X1 [Hyposmocoma kahamanoa]|uniref:transmembrane protein 47 isoform X1 n=1 Tax=Hyposmocoma kahamanoa TaxID=1477025 RepID=UPI000E6D8836|nr:transmembrane protein 47 isoform X1 [Hyposmocoma kahamanoa]XP_026327837.1 transmembrane protein 47 isoform X1 [Hyposmocoma kahamanoa]